MSAGFVYLLSNPAMPCFHKIGMSERAPHQRLGELSSATCLPIPFTMNCYIEVADCRGVEADLHSVFADFRWSRSREFFLFNPRNMLHVVGALKYHEMALAYAEGDISDFYACTGAAAVPDPWLGKGEIDIPHPPLRLHEVREVI